MITRIVTVLFLIWNLPWFLIALVFSPFIKTKQDVRLMQEQYEAEQAKK